VLLLINGAPGVGKSTLARRYADDHALSLVVEIDAIRTQLGGWQTHEESRLIARDLAVALVRAHLAAGHDVVVPQYLGRPEFRDELRRVAGETGARMVEVILTDDPERIASRFRERRAEHSRAGTQHPEGDLADAAVEEEVRAADDGLVAGAAVRAAPVISAHGGPDATYRSLLDAVARA
jgi:predicted kinase